MASKALNVGDLKEGKSYPLNQEVECFLQVYGGADAMPQVLRVTTTLACFAGGERQEPQEV